MSAPDFRIPNTRDIERLAFEGRISVAELCRRAEVHASTFRYWKSGRSSPSVVTVQALLDAGLAAVESAERAEPAPKIRPRAALKAAAAATPAATTASPRGGHE